MSTAVTGKSNGLKQLINGEDFKKAILQALPQHLSVERFIRISSTALTKNPKLLSCTPASFTRCLIELSMYGLEPDGRNAHLIPYGKECTLIIDYKGLVRLLYQTNSIDRIHADVVCENDVFEENMGEVTKHVINRKDGRGDIYAAYSMVIMKNGIKSFCVMGREELNSVRNASKNPNGVWKTWEGEMCKKAVIRRHCKLLPLQPETMDNIAKIDNLEYDLSKKEAEPRRVIDVGNFELGGEDSEAEEANTKKKLTIPETEGMIAQTDNLSNDWVMFSGEWAKKTWDDCRKKFFELKEMKPNFNVEQSIKAADEECSINNFSDLDKRMDIAIRVLYDMTKA